MDQQFAAPVTQAFTKVGLGAGSTTTLTETLAGGATSVIYAIRSKMYSSAAFSNTATPTTDYATQKTFLPVLANQGCVFLVGRDHSGNMKVIQGNIQNLDTVSVPGSFLNAPVFGGMGQAGSDKTLANDFCPVGYLLIQAGSTADNVHGWRFGTDNMSGVTGITYTFDDVCALPDRPQTT